jgi:prevent-host-death family protein
MEVDIHEAKTHLSKLIERVQMGEEVIIARAGKPVVKMIRVGPRKRILGHAAGKIRFTEGWEKPLTEAELQRLIGE